MRDELKHYGVKGMKWGVTKEERRDFEIEKRNLETKAQMAANDAMSTAEDAADEIAIEIAKRTGESDFSIMLRLLKTEYKQVKRELKLAGEVAFDAIKINLGIYD